MRRITIIIFSRVDEGLRGHGFISSLYSALVIDGGMPELLQSIGNLQVSLSRQNGFNRSRRRLELRSAFTQERAVTFPKKTFFPLAGNGWLLSRSVARASKHSARSCSATFVSSALKLIERGGDDFRMNAQTNVLRLRQNLNLL